jgi:hypothetical protein
MLGSLEFVSQIVSMFFLSVYGWINGAAFFEKISENPSYRPTFNAPTAVSFYGMFVSYAIMYMFDPKIMLLVIITQATLFFWLYKSKKSMKLESVWDGVFFQLLRKLLKRMDKNEKGKKNWRPTIVAFCANHLNRDTIANLLHWIGEKRSLTKLYFLIPGSLKRNSSEWKKSQRSLDKYTDENELDLFPKSIVSDDFEDTINVLMQAESLGNMPLNTVLIDYDKNLKVEKLLNDMISLKKNVIIVRNQTGFTSFKQIDIWWKSERKGNFAILLAYLISHSKQWLEQGATIRILKILEEGEPEEKDKLKEIIEDSRIENVEVKFIRKVKKTTAEIIAIKSEHADLVILGIPEHESAGKDMLESINEYTEHLKVSLVILANDKIDFKVN